MAYKTQMASFNEYYGSTMEIHRGVFTFLQYIRYNMSGSRKG
ncbi:hypothetical protein [Salipaludibacillus keqinensis]|nr:hypothetical protein [Salipaludibacillus keqinensis]